MEPVETRSRSFDVVASLFNSFVFEYEQYMEQKRRSSFDTHAKDLSPFQSQERPWPLQADRSLGFIPVPSFYFPATSPNLLSSATSPSHFSNPCSSVSSPLQETPSTFLPTVTQEGLSNTFQASESTSSQHEHFPSSPGSGSKSTTDTVPSWLGECNNMIRSMAEAGFETATMANPLAQVQSSRNGEVLQANGTVSMEYRQQAPPPPPPQSQPPSNPSNHGQHLLPFHGLNPGSIPMVQDFFEGGQLDLSSLFLATPSTDDSNVKACASLGPCSNNFNWDPQNVNFWQDPSCWKMDGCGGGGCEFVRGENGHATPSVGGCCGGHFGGGGQTPTALTSCSNQDEQQNAVVTSCGSSSSSTSSSSASSSSTSSSSSHAPAAEGTGCEAVESFRLLRRNAISDLSDPTHFALHQINQVGCRPESSSATAKSEGGGLSPRSRPLPIPPCDSIKVDSSVPLSTVNPPSSSSVSTANAEFSAFAKRVRSLSCPGSEASQAVKPPAPVRRASAGTRRRNSRKGLDGGLKMTKISSFSPYPTVDLKGNRGCDGDQAEGKFKEGSLASALKASCTSIPTTYSAKSYGKAKLGFTSRLSANIVLPGAGPEGQDMPYPDLEGSPEDYFKNDGPFLCRSDRELDPYASSDVDRPESNHHSQDVYAPRFTRLDHQIRQGWCSLCTKGGWYWLKRSQYLYHLQYEHGISSITRRPYRPPAMMRIWDDPDQSIEGLCSMCDQWIPICYGPLRKRSFKPWFKHAHACHRKKAAACVPASSTSCTRDPIEAC